MVNLTNVCATGP